MDMVFLDAIVPEPPQCVDASTVWATVGVGLLLALCCVLAVVYRRRAAR